LGGHIGLRASPLRGALPSGPPQRACAPLRARSALLAEARRSFSRASSTARWSSLRCLRRMAVRRIWATVSCSVRCLLPQSGPVLLAHGGVPYRPAAEVGPSRLGRRSALILTSAWGNSRLLARPSARFAVMDPLRTRYI